MMVNCIFLMSAGIPAASQMTFYPLLGGYFFG